MKNVYGLLLALGLGVAGGVFNWAYLRSEAQNMVMTSFIGLAADVRAGASPGGVQPGADPDSQGERGESR